jgi:protoporphyrinogen oxidase
MQAPVIIIGAGPAGLAAAYELVQHGVRPLVLEKADKVGGIARTEQFKGHRFDIGGHRFHTKAAAIQRLWEDMLDQDLLTLTRLSHIYYGRRFYDYPLNVTNALSNLGVTESVGVLLSYLWARLRPQREEDNFEQWVINRFGRRLYEMFFRTYTEKVWGIPCSQIRSDWAAQRIPGLSLASALSNALFGLDTARSLITEFRYPKLGPGQMWQRFREAVEGGGAQVWLNCEVLRVRCEGSRATGVVVRRSDGECEVAGDHVISSMPLSDLVARLDPAPPDAVLQAASELRYRDFMLVGLILKQAQPFPDHWIYVHSPQVQVGRVQSFRNWSPAMVADERKTSLGMEYFCSTTEPLWQMSDGPLINLAAAELEELGLAKAGDVEEGVVFRQARAYPLYDQDYATHVAFIRGFLATLANVQTIGRNGMHRYNNMDHSMITGMLAAENALGERHDLWTVNTEATYHEQA